MKYILLLLLLIPFVFGEYAPGGAVPKGEEFNIVLPKECVGNIEIKVSGDIVGRYNIQGCSGVGDEVWRCMCEREEDIMFIPSNDFKGFAELVVKYKTVDGEDMFDVHYVEFSNEQARKDLEIYKKFLEEERAKLESDSGMPFYVGIGLAIVITVVVIAIIIYVLSRWKKDIGDEASDEDVENFVNEMEDEK